VGAGGRLHLAPHPKIFEAPWCCSMRGAEGLAHAAQGNVRLDAARRTAWQLFYFAGESTLRLAGGDIVLECRSEYPHTGHVEWTVRQCPAGAALAWHFLVPPGVKAGRLTFAHAGRAVALREAAGFMAADLTLVAGDVLALDFPLAVTALQPATPGLPAGYHRFAHGPLLLGAEQPDEVILHTGDEFTALGRGRYECRRTGTVLGPIDGLTYLTEAAARAHRVQLLFADGPA
ncbi:MAG: glycoside hydrolase family 127 protein, partial [bacterium]|nr:glycoside hydrolase family 127 protein [bacterium]